MANDSAKRLLATNKALMTKYTRVILGCNVRQRDRFFHCSHNR